MRQRRMSAGIEQKTRGVAMSAYLTLKNAGALPRFVAGVVLGTVLAVAAHAQDAKKQAEDLIRQGQQQMSKGQPRDAMRTLSKAIELDPTNSIAYMARSRARDSSGRFEEALDDATKYIELEPTDEYGYLNRARIYLSLEKPEKALDDANKAIEMKPDEPDGYYRRADVYSALNKDAEAKADEKKADELDAKARR
jgi:tetratricopeptide (TPR) repeat protein